jgi:hypothetical protein
LMAHLRTRGRHLPQASTPVVIGPGVRRDDDE